MSRKTSVPSPLVALAGWVLPGSGYWLMGARSRGLTIGITVLILYVLGLWIGGIRIVEAPEFSDPSRNFLGHLLEKPWFLGQVLAGPLGLVPMWIADANDPVSHARVNDIGTLYTAVAGMLNLMAIIDSAYKAAHPPRPAPAAEAA